MTDHDATWLGTEGDPATRPVEFTLGAPAPSGTLKASGGSPSVGSLCPALAPPPGLALFLSLTGPEARPRIRVRKG